MEETTREIGGNSISLWLGNKLAKWGDSLKRKGSKVLISNPTAKLHSPYLLVLNFTIDNTDKYTITLQGEYKEKYKEKGTEEDPITIDEMFILIVGNPKKWFLKI